MVGWHHGLKLERIMKDREARHAPVVRVRHDLAAEQEQQKALKYSHRW